MDNIKMGLKREDGVAWTRLLWFRIKTNEHGNEHSGSIKCWEVLEELLNWRSLERDSAPWS
jgi:hypothetical protein